MHDLYARSRIELYILLNLLPAAVTNLFCSMHATDSGTNINLQSFDVSAAV